MNSTEREKLIKFCVETTAELNGVATLVVDENEFIAMSDDDLVQEANWLEDVLGK